MIGASIFIASMVAMVWPALTWSPTDTPTVTTPANGAATWFGIAPVGLLRGRNRAGDAAVTHLHRPQLAVDDAHHRAHAALVGFGDGLQADQQLDTGLQLHPVFLALPQAVEELVGRQPRGVAVGLPMLFEFLCRTRE